MIALGPGAGRPSLAAVVVYAKLVLKGGARQNLSRTAAGHSRTEDRELQVSGSLGVKCELRPVGCGPSGRSRPPSLKGGANLHRELTGSRKDGDGRGGLGIGSRLHGDSLGWGRAPLRRSMPTFHLVHAPRSRQRRGSRGEPHTRRCFKQQSCLRAQTAN